MARRPDILEGMGDDASDWSIASLAQTTPMIVVKIAKGAVDTPQVQAHHAFQTVRFRTLKIGPAVSLSYSIFSCSSQSVKRIFLEENFCHIHFLSPLLFLWGTIFPP